MLVWPGHKTMTLLPMLPTASIMPPPRPSPKASSRTRETTPQLMPSIVRAERMRLRRNAVQLCCTSSAMNTIHLDSFVTQAFDGVHVGGALRGIHSGAHRNERERQQRPDDRDDGNYWLGNEVRQRSNGQQETESDSDRVAERAAQNGESNRLAEELLEDVGSRRADRFQDANLAGALGDSDEHDVHDADAAETEGRDRHASEEDGDDSKNARQDFSELHGVPDEERVFVGFFEVMRASEQTADLEDGFIVTLRIGHFEHDVGEITLVDDFAFGWRRWKVARHGGVGHVNLVVVGPAVVGVLLLLSQHRDDGVGITGD